MRRLGISAAGIILIAAVLVAIVAINQPSDDEELEAFLGPGRIVESGSGRYGIDGHYWARYACGPESVRLHVKRHPFPARISQQQALRERFAHLSIAWPKNRAVYSKDWIEFKTGTGNYVLVAFPDDASQEVLYLKWDT